MKVKNDLKSFTDYGIITIIGCNYKIKTEKGAKMNKYIDSRKHKEGQPVIVICYDFDKALSPTDMQAQGFIQSVGCDVNEFWTESNALGEKNDMDQNLA